MISLSLAMLSGCFGGDDGAKGPPPNEAPSAPKQRVDSGDLELRSIDQSAFPDAVCADGSTPVFYFRRGTQEDKWLVYFKGNSVCRDAEQCLHGRKDVSSSDPWKNRPTLSPGDAGSMDVGGILSTNARFNPDFHDWNHAVMISCSLDNWSGDREASSETFGRHFRGRKITEAMMESLKDPDLVGSPAILKATEVLIAGSSGGAVGVRNNIDWIASDILPTLKVRGVADAAITSSERHPTQGGGVTEREGYLMSLHLWNPVLPERCLRETPKKDHYLCMVGRHLVSNHYVETPVFQTMDLRDPKMVGRTRDQVTKEFTQRAAIEIRGALADAEGCFVPAAGNHILLNSRRFVQPTVNSLSAAEVLGNWYFDRPGPKRAVEMTEFGPPAGRKKRRR